MSRSRKPLAEQRGHLTAAQRDEKKEQEKFIIIGKEQLKRVPKWLIDETAETEYKRLVKEFKKIDVIGNLDLNNVACYCNAYSGYRKATEELSGQSLMICKNSHGGADTMVENPLIKIQKNYAEEMRKFAATIGLTIDSRLKAACFKTTRESENIIKEFGDF